jgi:hypothetical protein
MAVLCAGLAGLITAQQPTAKELNRTANTEVLAEVAVGSGTAWEAFEGLLKSAEQPGGLVISTGCTAPIRTAFFAPAKSPISTVLDLLIAVFPGHRWIVQDGAIDLVPARLPPLLQTSVTRFEWNTSAAVQLNVQRLFQSDAVRNRISQLGLVAGLDRGPGLQRPPRVVDGVIEAAPRGEAKTLDGVTLIGVLNAVVASYRTAVWRYEERTCEGPTTYSVLVR